MAVGAVVARILSQYSDKGSKQAQKDIAKLGKNIDKFGKKAAQSFGLVTAASAAFAVKIGKDAVKAAIDDSKSANTLAKTLQNVTGATTQGIAAVEDYIKKQQMAANVADDELRRSLGLLVTATGDATSAMDLQNTALDVAAGTGRDLQAVTLALVRAQQGNLGALKRLGVPLDDSIVKNKDFAQAVTVLNKAYAGQAKLLGDTDPLKRLSLAYGEVLETLGYALLPVVIDFTEYIQTDVLPGLEEWIKLNEDQLQKSLEGVTDIFKVLIDNTDNFVTVLNILVGISNFLNSSILGVVKWGEALLGIFVLLKIIKAFKRFKIDFGLSRGSIGSITIVAKYKESLLWITTNAKNVAASIGIITAAFRAQGIAAGIAAIATAFATAGASVGLAVTALAAIGVGYLATKNALDAINKKELVHTDILNKQLDVTRENHAEVVRTARAKADQDKIDKARAASAAKAAAAANKQAAIDIKNIELRGRLEKKYGLRLTDQDEYENIQLTAVEMLQKKQKDADAALAERIKRRKEEVLLFEALNQNAEKYTDLLKVLSDQTISNEEIAVLAKKWGMTTDAVKSYIFTIFAIKDTTVSNSEVSMLATAWGMTTKQAEKYLDFFGALNDGKLSETEITKLMSKWGDTREAALKYADFVSAIGDGKLNDSEIVKLGARWGLTTLQVVEYIKQIGGRVDATGTILSAGDIAALGWTNALNALNEYLRTAGKAGLKTEITTPTGAGPDLASLEANAAKLREVTAKLLSMQEKIKNTVKIPDTPVSSGGGGGGGLRGPVAMANGGIVTSATQALIGEAGAEAVIPLNRIGNVLSSLTDLDGIGSGRSNNTNITVNVAGSVTSENDLVAAIRNGLLATQFNGNSLTIRAI